MYATSSGDLGRDLDRLFEVWSTRIQDTMQRCGGASKRLQILSKPVRFQAVAHTCVFLSMNMSAFGALESPKCTTLLPNQVPICCWHWARICAIAFATCRAYAADT
jgi:hypothetical protein